MLGARFGSGFFRPDRGALRRSLLLWPALLLSVAVLGLVPASAAAAAPANDDLANAEELTGGLPLEVAGTSAEATKEIGEPNHAASPGGGGASVWYEWTPNVSRPVLLSGSCGLAAVYTGGGYGSLAEVASTLTCFGGLRFEVEAGTTYRIAVDDDIGSGGPFSLTIRDATPPANDDFADAATLGGPVPIQSAGTTLDATLEEGEPDHGFGSASSVWYSWTPEASGLVAVETDTCVAGGSGFDTSVVAYTGTEVGALTQVGTSASAGCGGLARFDASSGTEYLIAVDGGTPAFASDTANFDIEIRELDPPANDDFANAQELTGSLPISEAADNFDATKEPDEPDHAGDPGGASVWYSWTPAADRRVLVSGVCSGLIAVYTGDDLGTLTEVVGSNGGCPSAADFEAEAGVTYLIALDGAGGQTGQGTIEIRDFNPPANDDFADAEALTGALPVTSSGTTVDATREPDEPSHGGFDERGSVWYSWTAGSDGTAVVELDGCGDGSAGFPPERLLAVYTGDQLTGLSPLASATGCDARLRFEASSETTYRIAVGEDGMFPTGDLGFDIALRELDPPGNDDFSNATALAGPLPISEPGTNLDATRQTNEPDHTAFGFGFGETASVWYSWTAPSDGAFVAELDEGGSCTGPSRLALYTGATLLALSSVAAAEDSCGLRVDFDASEGVTYRIAVDGAIGGGEGEFALGLREFDPPPNDDFADAEQLGGPLPIAASGDNIDAGKESPDEPDHAGSPGGPSVWYSWTPAEDVSAALGLDSCNAGQPFFPLVAVYTGANLGSLSEVTSSSMFACADTLDFEASGETTYLIAIDGQSFGDDGQGEFELSIADGGSGDTTPPDTSIDSGPGNGETIDDPTPTFGFSGSPLDDVDHFECSVDGGFFVFCASPQSTPPLGDGEHTVKVRAVDAAGNQDPTPAERSFTVDTSEPDTTPPDTAIDSGPANGSTISNATPTFGFSGTPAGDVDRFECRLDDGSFADCTPPHTPASLADGEHTFEVRAVDAAENADPSPASRTFTVDTTPPDTAIDAGPEDESTIAEAMPTFGFSSAAGDVDRFECRLDDGSFAGCSSPLTTDELADGAHAFRVRAVDGAGNADPTPAIRGFTVDTAGPALTIDSGPDGPTTDTAPSFAFTAEEGTVECSIDDGTPAFGACDTGSSHGPATPLADGDHTFRVRATDAVGNATTRTREFTVDTTAPQTAIVSGPSGETKRTSPSFALGADEAGATFECRLDSDQEGDWQGCASPKSYSGLSDGEHTFEVRATDPAGNVDSSAAERTWTIDSTATTETTEGEAPAGGTVSSSPSGEEPDEETPVTAAITTPGGGTVKIVTKQETTQTPPSGFEIFGQEIEITADPATIEDPLVLTFVLDASLIPAGTDLSLVTVFRDGEPAADCEAEGEAVPDPCIAERNSLASGDLELTALSAHASAWNLGTAPDTTAPETAIDKGPAAGSTIADATPTFEFSGSPASDVDHFECRLDDGSFDTCGSPRTLATLADGEHTFRVRAVDATGNADETPARRSFTVDTSSPADPDPPVDEPEPPVDEPGPPTDETDPPVEKPSPPDGDDDSEAKCERAEARLEKAQEKARKANAKKRKAKQGKKKAAKKARKTDSRKAAKKLEKAQKKMKKAKRRVKQARKRAKRAKRRVAEACG